MDRLSEREDKYPFRDEKGRYYMQGYGAGAPKVYESSSAAPAESSAARLSPSDKSVHLSPAAHVDESDTFLDLAALASQRSIKKIQLDEVEKPCAVAPAKPNGDCGFLATQLSLKLQAKEELAAIISRVAFIELVTELWSSSSLSVEVRDLIQEIFTEDRCNNLIQWQERFKSSGYWCYEPHFKLLSYKHNLIFKFYTIDDASSQFVPELSYEMIYKGQNIDTAQTIYLAHISTRLLDKADASLNHYDPIIIDPTEAQSAQIEELISQEAVSLGHDFATNSESHSSVKKEAVSSPLSLSGSDSPVLAPHLVDRIEGDEAAGERDPFYTAAPTVVLISPVSVMRELYAHSTTPQQKQACFRYLLQYQHFNADYTKEERRRLGYYPPLIAEQVVPGYIRTKHHELLIDLIKPWIDRKLTGFYDSFSKKGALGIKEYLTLGSSSAVDVLKANYAKKHRVLEPEQFFARDDWEEISKSSVSIMLIRLSVDELSAGALDAVNKRLAVITPKVAIGALRIKRPDLKFLFVLEQSNIECMMWGAQWARPTKNNALECIGLEQLFDKTVFSHLNIAGAVPDRLAVNRFLTEALVGGEASSFDLDLEPIGFKAVKHSVDLDFSIDHLQVWKSLVLAMDAYEFKEDPGLALYRDAILHWQRKFFECFTHAQEFAAPLLYSQVLPWLSEQSGLVQWAKAYQNLCEILLLCFDYFPDLSSEADYESAVLESLDPGNLIKARTVKLYSYAMSSIFDVFHQILNRPEFKGRALSAACISQNYFEILGMVTAIAVQNSIEINKADSLADLVKIPNILIADIHPNNAAQKKLFQNDIAGWIHKKLVANPEEKLILIVDITLNNLSDPVVHELLARLKPFIDEGRLEIFGIQSLAKLVQLGADNFSGGSCFYLGNSEAVLPRLSSSVVPYKAAYFSFLTQNFQDITSRYFSVIRRNADWVYQQLAKRFADISKQVTIRSDDQLSESRFCATNIILNTDEGTVYVAIGFTGFFKKMKMRAGQEEKLVRQFRLWLLQLAELRGLPITGRQSFGFSLSNMSDTLQAIRFSIGAESLHLLNQYIDLITDFSYALSKFTSVRLDKSAAGILTDDELKLFMNTVIDIYAGLKAGGWSKAIVEAVPLLEDDFDESGDDYKRTVGKVDVYFRGHRLRLDKKKEAVVEGEASISEQVTEPNIRIESRNFSGGLGFWPYDYLFRLLFQLNFMKISSVYVFENGIGGFIEEAHSFTNNSSMRDTESGINVIFKPEFSLSHPDATTYTMNDVFVMVPALLGTVEVRLSKLDAATRSTVFSQCVQYRLTTKPHRSERGCIVLEFGVAKPTADYSKDIRSLWRRGRLSGIVNYLNELDFNNLPVLINQAWYEGAPTASKRILELMKVLANSLIKTLSLTDVEMIKLIKSDSCKKELLEGLYEVLFELSLSETNLDLGVGRAIASLFSCPELQPCLIYFGDRLDEWILSMEAHMIKNSGDLERLHAYLVAIFPLVRRCYSGPLSLTHTDFTLPLRKIAELATFMPEWARYFSDLEQKIIEKASNLQNEALELHKRVQTLTRYLELYLFYPLTDEIKSQLAAEIAKSPVSLRSLWIDNPDFYYQPLDSSGMSQIDLRDELVLGKSHQDELRKFFQETGCKDLLLGRLSVADRRDSLSGVLRWAIMTQDADLFLAVLDVCKRSALDVSILEQLKFYVDHLDRSNVLQERLFRLLSAAPIDSTSLARFAALDIAGTASVSSEERSSLVSAGLFAAPRASDTPETAEDAAVSKDPEESVSKTKFA